MEKYVSLVEIIFIDEFHFEGCYQYLNKIVALRWQHK